MLEPAGIAHLSVTRSLPVELHATHDGFLQWMLNNFHVLSGNGGKVTYNVHTLLSSLKSCRHLQQGRRIHAKAVESRYESSMYVVTALIRMYGKCGSMLDAHRMFDEIQNPDVVCWTALIVGYVENGDGHATLGLFSKMKASGCAPDSVSYVAALKACTFLAGKRDARTQGEWLNRGREIHSEIGSGLDIFVQSTLTGMYAKCGSMLEARCVFESIQNPNVVCWNALLLGYAENGDGLATLELFSKMKSCRCSPDCLTYVAALKACASLAVSGRKRDWLERGRSIHSETGFHLNLKVQNTLIGMYAKCGSMVDARCVFDGIQKPDVVSWNVLLLGYVENGEGRAALELFWKMKACGTTPVSGTYVAALKACTSLLGDGQNECLKRGKEIHSEIGCNMGMFVQSTLADMYAKCGSMVDARRVFESIPNPDVVSWNAILVGYADNGEGLATLELFSKMKACGCAPDSVTYVAALKACTSLALKEDWLESLKHIHLEIGSHLDLYVRNTLISLYAKCGSMIDARSVFHGIQKPDVVSWNALLFGYTENGDGLATLELFSKMKACGYVPDSVTYVASLGACSLIGSLAFGRKLHSEISEFTAQVVTSLVDFYAKCGSIVEAHDVFNAHAKVRDVSTWTALLTGYGSFGDTVTAFDLFKEMQDQGFEPNAVTFVCVLSCCSHAGLLEKAWKYFEAISMKYGITPTVMHYTCMVDVLGRANQLNEAFAMLRKMPCNPNAVTWLTLLGACHKWKNVEIGRCAFLSLMDIDKKNVRAYILMAHIYGSRGMWEEQDRVLEAKEKLDSWEMPEQAYVYDEFGNMVKFVVGKEDPPGVKEKLEELLESYGVAAEKQEPLCGHSGRRAVVYGILRTPPNEPVRAFKNIRMCDFCHGSSKMISKLCGRVIMVRDASRLHFMVNGNCACGDYW